MKYYLTKRNNGLHDQFNDAFDFFRPFFYSDHKLMTTDIKENEKQYTLDIDMAGFEKNEISLKMDKGYLIVSAEKQESEEQEQHEYITRERATRCSRSYYLGEVDEKAVTARYNNGVLSVVVPKKMPEQTEHSITIE